MGTVMSTDDRRGSAVGGLALAFLTFGLAAVALAHIAFVYYEITRMTIVGLVAGLVSGAIVVWLVVRYIKRNEDEWLRVRLGGAEPRGWFARSFGVPFGQALSGIAVLPGFVIASLFRDGAQFAFLLGWLVAYSATVPSYHRYGRRYQRIHDGEEPLPERDDASDGADG